MRMKTRRAKRKSNASKEPSHLPAPNQGESTRKDRIGETVPDTTVQDDGIQGETGPDAAKCGVQVIQETFSEHSIGENCQAKRTCVVCDTHGDQVLVCSDSSCPLALHEKCMSIEPSYDDKGDFYCPYCWYKRAVDKAENLRRKVLMVEKNLLDFINMKVPENDRQEQEFGEIRTNEPTTNLREKDCHAGNSEMKVTDTQNQYAQVDKEQLNEGVNVTSADGDQCTTILEQCVNGRKNSACKQDKTESGSDEPKGSISEDLEEKEDLQEEAIENHPESTTMSKRSKLLRQSHKRGSRPPVSNQRRIFWTADEENKLKEGVKKFQEANKNLPWRKILEFGRPVFHSTRTPAQLKDKWRKILAKESSKIG